MMSTVIKKGQTSRLMHRLVSLDLADHLAEADKVVASARRQARQMLEAARIKGERIGQQAQEEGYAAGLEQGRVDGRQEGKEQALAEATARFEQQQAELVGALGDTLRGIEDRKGSLAIQAERDLLVFAVEMAKKVTHGVGNLDSRMARANVEKALRLVGQRSNIRVRINPQDADTLRQFASQLAEQTDASAHVCIVEDAAITPGGAVVQAGEMEVDAQLETQLGQLAAVLLGQDMVDAEPGGSPV